MQNVLIVAPDLPEHPPLHVARALVAADYDIGPVTFGSPPEALREAFRGRLPDLIVADLSDGAELLSVHGLQVSLTDAWGEGFPMPPVLLLATRAHLSAPELRYFADDLLLPPYDPQELTARVMVLLFRQRHIEPGGTIQLAGMRLNAASGKAHASDGAEIPLTPREFELLRFLATHRGRSFSRERLLTLVWGDGYEGGPRTVDIHVRRLRAKLPSETARLLETRWGTGYCLRI